MKLNFFLCVFFLHPHPHSIEWECGWRTEKNRKFSYKENVATVPNLKQNKKKVFIFFKCSSLLQVI